MPGHFTHIYAARRVADLLASGDFADWPEGFLKAVGVNNRYGPKYCGEIMQRWEKFTAIGAIGPDLFYFSQDYNGSVLGPETDLLMLSLATYYFFDAAKEDDWEPLLIILEDVNDEMASILRLLIKLKKIWDEFVASWNATIGPLVSAATSIGDDLTGGLISEFEVTINELKQALIALGEEELLTFKDIFTWFDSCVQKGYAEDSFLWSDMSHYRNASSLCQALVDEAEALRDGSPTGGDQFEQFLAFALGYMTHIGADVIGHSFINEQVGGPYRNHPQRHHLIENHIDAWHYKQSGFNPARTDTSIPTDLWSATADYPDLSMSAMWFAIQLTPDKPKGEQRPSPLPDDADARKAALDVDGEMPMWMAESIVKAMIKTFGPRPHPKIYQGDVFQNSVDEGMLTDVVKTVTGHGLDRAFDELLNDIAPAPSFPVPPGFPLPWQIQTMYKIGYSFYRFSYNGTWELQKPRKPDFIITPPSSDFTNLFQPPDFSGVDSSNPLVDICEIFIALFEWAIKELGAAAQLAGDLIKMAVSPASYPFRLGLYELAMMMWDVAMKTHDVLAHTGFMIPHAEQRYDDGELRLPNEIDLPLLTLGASVDSAFQQALADAIDPFGNLDKNPDLIGRDHLVPDPNYPYYPVLRYRSGSEPEGWEYRRPWAYPNVSLVTPDGTTNIEIPTPTEPYDPSLPAGIAPRGPFASVSGGPYSAGTRPDQVFFRTSAPVNRRARVLYENAQSPAETDLINQQFLNESSPLGDIVPFSAYLIGQLSNHTGYATQWNMDSDRGYGYLTWDWIRGAQIDPSSPDFPDKFPKLPYNLPNVAPAGDVKNWDQGTPPGQNQPLLQLKYVDAVAQIGPARRPRPGVGFMRLRKLKAAKKKRGGGK